MQNDKFTRLTVEQSDRKLTWEVPYEDVGGEEVVQACASLMFGLTFLPITIIQSMRDYVEENKYILEKYNEEN